LPSRSDLWLRPGGWQFIDVDGDPNFRAVRKIDIGALLDQAVSSASFVTHSA
jgi:hypothetical protein